MTAAQNSTNSSPRFSIDDKVQSRADALRIGMVERLGPGHDGQQYYVVFWGGAIGTRSVGELDLLPKRESARPGEVLSDHLSGHSEFQRLITLQRLVRDQPLKNNIYARLTRR